MSLQEPGDGLAGSERPASVPPDKVGVLPFRQRDSELEFLLITSRSGRRWVIPKGGLGSGDGPRAAARNEAYEEAGVGGSLGSKPIGEYRHGSSIGAPRVQVFLMRVETQAESWPEQHERRCQWMPVDEAMRHVGIGGLRALLEDAAALLRAGPDRHPAIPAPVRRGRYPSPSKT